MDTLDERFTGKDTPQEIKNDGFNHKEAYCIMQYHCKTCNTSEKIWNSRDGVTPFCCHCKCGGEMRHINWQGDKRVVNHIPKSGDRIFITMPREVHDIYTRMRIEGSWDTGEYKMHQHFPTKEEAFKQLADSYTEGQPFIMIWE